MKTRSQEPYWLLKNGLLTIHPSLQQQITCQSLIIGGGITGALVAYQLGKDGHDVVLVDKRDLAFGSTSATTALLQYEIDEPLIELKKKVGAGAIAAYRAGVEAISKIEHIIDEVGITCGFSRKKSVYLAHSQKDSVWMQKEFKARAEIGLPVHWLTKSETYARYGAIAEGAIESECGGSIDAYSFTHHLLEYCRSNFKVKVFDHTEVIEIDYQENKPHDAIVTGDHRIIFENLVYATGYETKMPTRKNIVDLISTYAFVSEPIPGLSSSLRETIFWNTQKPYFYLRTTEDGRLLCGGADEKFKNPLRRDMLIEKKERILLDQLKSVFPSVNAIPDFSWAGTFGVTKDALPYIGAAPNNPNTYYVLGFGGNGITFSIMGMEIISDLMADRKNLLSNYFGFDR